MLWKIQEKAPVSFFQEFSDLPPLLAQLLYHRGIRSRAGVDAFVHPDWKRDVHDPFLFRDMQRAIARTFAAIEAGERVKIFADYDADGVTAGTVIYTTLVSLGVRDVSLYIPDRHLEGYGVKDEVIDQCISEGITLLVTVDVGISAHSALQKAKEAGIDVIVCDHHHILSLPEAYAIIHPLREDERYPDKNLSGVGVTYKFAQGLLQEQRKRIMIQGTENREQKNPSYPLRSEASQLRTPASIDAFEKWLLDLVAIGTIADVVPLLGENRALVKFGLLVLAKTKRPGLKELLRVSGLVAKTSMNRLSLTPRDIGWGLAPRLNAASRMDHGSVAFRLLESKDPEESRVFAAQIDDLNKERQKLTSRIRSEVESRLEHEQTVVVLSSPDWPTAVCGLVAGRIADTYQVPVFLCEEKKTADGKTVFEGSARGVAGLDLMEVLFDAKEFLFRYGGHAAACGFAVLGEESFAAFHARVRAFVHTRFSDGFQEMLSIDCCVSESSLTEQTIDDLRVLEPCGEGNEKPVFCLRSVTVIESQWVGKESQHLRTLVKTPKGMSLKAMAFNGSKTMKALLIPGAVIDLAFTLEENEWNGKKDLFLKVVDARAAE